MKRKRNRVDIPSLQPHFKEKGRGRRNNKKGIRDQESAGSPKQQKGTGNVDV
jgi:hypothetical protein